MPRHLVDVAGQRFGRLVALDHLGRGFWACRCDCGASVTVTGFKLRAHHTRSCGCYGSEQSRARVWKHGLTGSPEHSAWMGLIRRCEDPRRADYPRYGGRGIRVCQRWRESFEAFLADMGSRPTRRHSLDRIDVNGNYEPGNCRWATGSTQAKNKRNYHPPVEKSCVICGARFMVPASATARRLCCSMHCRGVLGSRARRRVNGAFA